MLPKGQSCDLNVLHPLLLIRINPSIDCQHNDHLSDQQSFKEKALFGQWGLSDTVLHCWTDPFELMYWRSKGVGGGWGVFQSIVTHTLSAHLASGSFIVQSTVCKFSHSASLLPSTLTVTGWTPPMHLTSYLLFKMVMKEHLVLKGLDFFFNFSFLSLAVWGPFSSSVYISTLTVL